jgi:hypothetical protein
MYEWNRRQLWSSHDARHASRSRTRVLLAVGAIGALAVGLATIHISCLELYYVDADRHVPARPAPAECKQDADCALMPALFTCCGECEPMPPFQAVTKRRLDALRSDTDAQCAPPTRLCDPPICSPLSPACEARAICVEGACRVEATHACIFR